MRKYNLLKESDIIPNNHYLAIVYYPYPSPNRNAMTEWVYYDDYKQWCGTDKDISKVVDESVISVLFEYNPERAYEIIQGGYVEDGHHNDLLKSYDFRLQKKLNEWLIDKGDYDALLDKFSDTFPFVKIDDYRPICHELFTDGKVGITVWLDNGDIIEYYPKQKGEV